MDLPSDEVSLIDRIFNYQHVLATRSDRRRALCANERRRRIDHAALIFILCLRSGTGFFRHAPATANSAEVAESLARARWTGLFICSHSMRFWFWILLRVA